MRISYDEVINSALKGEIPWKLARSGLTKIKVLSESVRDVEKKASLSYPPIIIEPVLKILIHEEGTESLVHGYVDVNKETSPPTLVVKLSLPFVLQGGKRLFKCVLSHELLHYIYFIYKVTSGDVLMMEQTLGNTFYSHLLFDEARSIPAEEVFKDKKVALNLRKRCEKELNNEKFLSKILTSWIERGLPTIHLPEADFIVRLTPEELLSIKVPEDLSDLLERLKAMGL